MKQRWKIFFLYMIIPVLCIVLGVVCTVFVYKPDMSLIKEYKTKCAEQDTLIQELYFFVEWFTTGYIETYEPDRILFSGAPVKARAEVAAHPFLPIGTMLFIKNLRNNMYTVLPVLDRKYIMSDRVILSLSHSAANEIDLRPNDRCIIKIMTVPPAYDANKWYNNGVSEHQAAKQIKKELNRRKSMYWRW